MPVHGTEFLVLILLAFIILGPKQLPEYAAKLARVVVKARRMANDAKVQLKEQMGPEYEDLDWRQYDPRQYDPRRIVRQALLEPLDDAPERLAQEMHAFLSDERAVRADLELVHSGLGDDPRLRELALRWTDRLVEILARHLDPYVAEAIGLYLDGATLHAGLHDEPVSAETLARVFRALMSAPTTATTTTEGSDPR